MDKHIIKKLENGYHVKVQYHIKVQQYNSMKYCIILLKEQAEYLKSTSLTYQFSYIKGNYTY